MIELLIMDENFNILSVMDDFTSLAWNQRFYGVGGFQIDCNISYANIINQAKYVYRNDSKQTGVIDYINPLKSLDGGWNLVVRGKFLKQILDDRAINQTMRFYNQTVEDIILSMIEHHFINNKRFDKVAVNRTGEVTQTISMQVTGKSVLEKIIELEEEQNVTCQVEYDHLNDSIVCSVKQGKLLTTAQNDNQWVVFSEDRENMYDVDYSKTLSYKNFAYVAGTGQGSNRTIVTVTNRQPNEPLKELYVNAGDISDLDDDGNPIPRDRYLNHLRQRGREKLAEYTVVEELTAKVNSTDILVFGKDYDLGDIVEFQAKEIGLNTAIRIIGADETLENGVNEMTLLFGKERLTLEGKIKREVR